MKESNKMYFLYKWHDKPVRLSLLPSLSFLFPHIFAYLWRSNRGENTFKYQTIKSYNHITIKPSNH